MVVNSTEYKYVMQQYRASLRISPTSSGIFPMKKSGLKTSLQIAGKMHALALRF